MEKKNTVKFIYETAGRTKWKIGLLFLVRVLIASISVASALLLRDLINAAVEHNQAQFLQTAVIWMALIGLRIAVGVLNRFLQEDTVSELENKWKSRLFSALLKKNYAYISSVHSGEWMTRLTNDTVIVANGMANLLPDLGSMMVRLLGAAGAIILIEPGFLYLILPGAVILFIVSYVSRKKMKALHRNIQEQDGKLRSFLQECFAGMLVIRTYGTEMLESHQAEEKMARHKAARMERNCFSNVCSTGFSILMNGVYVLGACYCGYGILIGQISYGTFTAILQLIGQLQNPLANLSGVLPRYYSILSSAERLLEAEEAESAVVERKTLQEVQEAYRNGIEKLVLENISFSYQKPLRDLGKETCIQDKCPAVSGWNFEIKKGEYVAITGPSGGGKSTLLKLLLCLYEPDQGSRYLMLHGKQCVLDGSWQRLFAYVPQGHYLMSGTIREMVVFADHSQLGNDQAIWKALSVACADEFVRKLEHGLDSELGERGAGLSEGQMQRLAIARAVFSNCPFLILDECSSALDEVTEAQLLHNLRAMTDRTVIIVTHRPAALGICDRIYQIADGITSK